MKKKVLLIVFLALFFVQIFSLSINAQQEDINRAYQCLEDRIEEQTCEGLSVSEKIFTVLATKDCRSELMDDSSNDECWPSGNCDVKTTSQAILALGKSGTSDAQDWLLSQIEVPVEIKWFLQADSSEASTCEVLEGSNTYTFNIAEDKKLSSEDTSSCLTITPNGYFLEIAPECQDQDFEISCNQDFVTNLIFQKEGSSTIHVSEETSSAASGGATLERVESLCFSESGVCDYESSLWAALALDFVGEGNLTSYLPYLISFADEDENDKFLPESFLYHITGYAEFESALLSKQRLTGFWSVSGNQYFDTALALYPFLNEQPQEKTKAQETLLDNQQQSGCWNSNNIRDTAFILASVWPKYSSGTGGGIGSGDDNETTLNCINSGYSCLSSYNCYEAGGNVLDDYSCTGIYSVCCSSTGVSETCSEIGGEICSSSETCSSSTVSSEDSNSCCLGTCVERTVDSNDCESFGGFCETTSCGDGYTSTSEYSCSFGDICCFRDSPSSKSGVSAWLIILIVLILLVTIAIIFKDNLRMFWLKMTSGSRKDSSRPSSFRGFPPLPPSSPAPRRVLPRRIIPREPPRPSAPTPVKRKPKNSSELDEILEKLKRIGR